MTEYLIMGDGDMPLPEMRAAVDELLEANPGAALDVLDSKGPFVDKVAQYWAKSGSEVYFYDEDADPDVVLLLTAESNFEVDEYWDILDEHKDKVKVYAFNEQMYEIVPEDDEPCECGGDHDGGREKCVLDDEPERIGPSDEQAEKEEVEAHSVKMNVVGDMEVLEEMSLPELKRVAKGLGVTPKDSRSRDSVMEAIKEEGKGAFGQPLAEVDVGEALEYQTKADNKEAFQEAEQALVDSIGEDGAVEGALVLSKEKASDLREWVSDTQILLNKISQLLGDF